MKTLKLRKKELEKVQALYDEIHGMRILVSDMARRNTQLERAMSKIIRTKTGKKYTQCATHFDEDGKISFIAIIE